MKKTIEQMQSYICDNICQYPCHIKDVGMLEEVCSECLIDEYVEDIQRKVEIEKGIRKCKNCGTEIYSVKEEFKCTKCGCVNKESEQND